MTTRILAVDSDESNVDKIVRLFNGIGYSCIGCLSATECLKILQNMQVDLIITELGLSDMSGTELCREIKYNDSTAHIPIVFLSGMNTEVDKVVGLSLGATDYVVKPYSSRELVLRVKAILRRTVHSRPRPVMSNGVIRLDSRSHRAWVDSRPLPLTRLEFKLLSSLVSAGGHVLTREQIIETVWGGNAHVLDRTVDAHIRTLRKKLGTAKGELETVQGVGYRIRQHEDANNGDAVGGSADARGYTTVNDLF